MGEPDVVTPASGSMDCAEESAVRYVSSPLQVPPFTRANPRFWFSQLEVGFRMHNITDDFLKFGYVYRALDPGFAEDVSDVVDDLPENGKYQRIKDCLIRRVAVPRERLFQELLTNEDMGDRTPSQFLRHLKYLGGKDVPDSLVEMLWLKRLPKEMQPLMIAASSLRSLEEQGEAADRVFFRLEKSKQSEAVVSRVSFWGVDQITHEVVGSKPIQGAQEGNSLQLQEIPRQDLARKADPPVEACWYHQRYGDKARQCEHPCGFRGAA